MLSSIILIPYEICCIFVQEALHFYFYFLPRGVQRTRKQEERKNGKKGEYRQRTVQQRIL